MKPQFFTKFAKSSAAGALVAATLLLSPVGHSAIPAFPEHTNVHPVIEAHVTLTGDYYDHSIQMLLPGDVEINRVREMVYGGVMIGTFSDWVKEASFTGRTQNSPVVSQSNFTLKIGMWPFIYTHNYKCDESNSTDKWQLVCRQTEPRLSDNEAVKNSEISYSCERGIYDDETRLLCDFKMSGQALKILKVAPRTLAYTLFLENTKYATHASVLLADLVTTTKDAKKMVANSELGKLINGLNAREKEAVNANSAQTYVVEATTAPSKELMASRR